MKKTKGTPMKDDTKKVSVLYMAFELSHTIWKLAFSDGQKMRTVCMEARNLQVLQEEIEKAKKKFKLQGAVRIVSCYEAGRDGFWFHRYLISCGLENTWWWIQPVLK